MALVTRFLERACMLLRCFSLWVAALTLTGAVHAATFIVNSDGDQPNASPGNGSAASTAGEGVVTLRSAIEEVNALEGQHIIHIDSSLVSRVRPFTPLPPLTRDNTVLEGSGATLDGSQISGTFMAPDGMVIEAPSCVVKDLRIQGFRGHGIVISGGDALSALIQGCTIGGLAGEGNGGAGILIEDGAHGALVGGASLVEANLIAGNEQAGIWVRGADTRSNMFQRNRIVENGVGPRGIVIEDGAQDGILEPELLSINPVRGRAAPNGQVELFVDRGGQAEVFVAAGFADGAGNFEMDLDLRDFITKPFLSVDSDIPFTRFLTATTMDTNGNTSAISNAVLIQGEPPESAARTVFQRVDAANRAYPPDGTLQVFITVERDPDILADQVEVVEIIPEGWTLAVSNASGAAVSPAPGSGPVLRWVFTNFPEIGRTFSYTVNIPPSTQGLVSIDGQATVTYDGINALASRRLQRELIEVGFARIDGKVEDFDTGQAITCAVVEFQSIDAPGTRHFAVVDGAGRFQFVMLPHGMYNERVLAPGYSSGTTLEVEVNSQFTILNFSLGASPSTAALVRGTVTDADSGQPLSGVFVRALDGESVLGSSYTCASGRYAISRPNLSPKGAKADVIEVEFSADNYEPASQSVSVPPAAPAEADQSLNKASIFPSALVGTVSAANTGAPPAGAQVLLNGPVNTLSPVGSAGTYAFDAILAGSYLVRVNAPGFEPAEKTKLVGSGAVETLNFSLTPLPPVENPFDINGDGAVNAVDVQLVINAALGLSIAPFNADVNGDGAVNAVDVQLVINAALGLK